MGAPVVAEATPVVFDPAKARVELDALISQFNNLNDKMTAMVASGQVDMTALIALGAEAKAVSVKRDRLERRISGGGASTSAESTIKREARDKAINALRGWLDLGGDSMAVGEFFSAVKGSKNARLTITRAEDGTYTIDSVGGIRAGGKRASGGPGSRPRALWTGKAIKGEPVTSAQLRALFGAKYGQTVPDGQMSGNERNALVAKIVDGEKLTNINAKAPATTA